MTRARRSFDRADLRRASLDDLRARLKTLAAQARGPGRPRNTTKGDAADGATPQQARAARRALTNQIKAIRAEIAVRLETGKPSEKPRADRQPSPVHEDTEDLRLGDFFETYPRSHSPTSP
jgi:hypothetical protein